MSKHFVDCNYEPRPFQLDLQTSFGEQCLSKPNHSRPQHIANHDTDEAIEETREGS